jgi:hypothetical protein
MASTEHFAASARFHTRYRVIELVSRRHNVVPRRQWRAPRSRRTSRFATDCRKRGRFVKDSFTKLQGQYLAFIVAYVKLNRRPPAEADFQRYFDVTPPSVHSMILTLERRGLIRRTPGRSRSIELLVPLSEIPSLGWRGHARPE